VEKERQGFCIFAERTVSRDWRQTGLISKYWILHFLAKIYRKILGNDGRISDMIDFKLLN